MKISKKHLVEAFAAWNKDIQNNPDKFCMSKKSIDKCYPTPLKSAKSLADTLVIYLKETE